MPHFYFPIHEQEPLTTRCRFSTRTVTILRRNQPINLDLVLTFGATTETYDFNSIAEARKEAALPGPVHAITFLSPVGDTHIWLFGDEMSRDAELRVLVKHLGGGADRGR